MSKLQIKIYLESGDYAKLKQKAEASGFQGRGLVSHYIEKISKTDVIFIDKNIETILALLPLSLKPPQK